MQRKDPLSKNFATPCVYLQLVRRDYLLIVVRNPHRAHKEKTLSLKTLRLRACFLIDRYRLTYLVWNGDRESCSATSFRFYFNFSFQFFNGIFYNKQAKSRALRLISCPKEQIKYFLLILRIDPDTVVL